MTLTLELTRELEQRLAAGANRMGLPVEKYALQLLGELPNAERRPTTGAEVVAFWKSEGVIGSRPDLPDSQAHARGLRRDAAKRKRN